MAQNTPILGKIKSSESAASLDAKYGPYASKAAADAALGENGDDVITAGLTVGVTQSDGSVKEFWYQPDGQGGLQLVEKQVAAQEETDPTVPAWAKAETKPSYTASEVGAIPDGDKGVANGVATLGIDGKVPQSQLPSYVDDVLEYSNQSSFPVTGESGKIYVALDTNKTYRWSGSAYVEISQSLALGETSSTAFAGDRGKAIEDKIPSNASSSNKLVTASDLNGKQDTISDLEQIRTRADEGHTALQPKQSGQYTKGNIVVFDANGGLSDSQKKTTDFATAEQGEKANNAIPMPSGTDGQILEKDSNETGGVKWVSKPSDGEDGLSAFEIAQQQGYTGTVDQWLASLKANIGAFQFITPTDTTAEAALTNIGSRYASAIGGVSPSQATLSIILLMNDSNNTKTMMIATQDDGNSGYEFVYAGDLQSAMPSNVLTEDDVDGTKLANPKNASLAKAEDVMQLKAKLEGVTASETKVTQQPTTGSYIKGSDGSIELADNTAYIEIALNNAKSVRFLGSWYTSPTYTGGYAFGHYTDPSDPTTWVTDNSSVFDTNASALGTKEYVVAVPEGSSHFRTTTATGAVPELAQNFYCYLLSGDSIGYKIIKIAAWGATNSSEITNVNVGDVVYNSTTRLLRKKVSADTYETVPYVAGAVYQYDDCLYVWNGTDLSLVSTTPIEIAKDSRETTALLREDGKVITDPSFTTDIVDKYYTYGGGVFAVSGRSISSYRIVMVNAYAKDGTFIQYFYPKSDINKELTKVPIILPNNTWYVKVHGNTLFNETKLYSLSQVDMNARKAFIDIDIDIPKTRLIKLNSSESYIGKVIWIGGSLQNGVESDLVERYVTYTGCGIYVSGRQGADDTFMVAAFDESGTFIKGVFKGNDFTDYDEVYVELPDNTYYVLVHSNTLQEHQPNGSKLLINSSIDYEARQEIEKLKSDDTGSGYSPEDCRRRFYKAMEEKCANLMMSGYIIEGPSGYGRYNAPSDEVENPILGHGQAQMPITGMCRIIANSLNYPFLANLWSEKERIIKSENTDFSYTLTRSFDEHYGVQLESEYTILAWKTGTRTGTPAPFYTNLVCAATNYNLNGKVLAGYVHLALDPLLEDEETNRCKAMKILFNIGETLLADRSADISSLQTQLLGQSVAHAEVMVYPSYAAFMSNFDAAGNSDYRLYHYYSDNSPMVNTFSTIKVLVTQVVLDYTDNLEEEVTITENDVYWAPYSGPIFSAGQKFTVRDLIYAFMMISCSQAGYALARHIGAKLLNKYGSEGFIPSE